MHPVNRYGGIFAHMGRALLEAPDVAVVKGAQGFPVGLHP